MITTLNGRLSVHTHDIRLAFDSNGDRCRFIPQPHTHFGIGDFLESCRESRHVRDQRDADAHDHVARHDKTSRRTTWIDARDDGALDPHDIDGVDTNRRLEDRDLGLRLATTR